MSRNKYHKRRQRKQKSNTKWVVLIVSLLVIVVTIIVVNSMLGAPGSNNNVQSINQVMLQTSMGNILIELRDDMPITTTNFMNLVKEGVYDGTIFHRVIADFMIQGGDPTGTGFGDPSIPTIQDEFSENPENNRNLRGTIAMANTEDPNSGSSQFFINAVYNSHLDNAHPVFGEVIEGMEVVDQILNVETDSNDKPIMLVTINSAYIVD